MRRVDLATPLSCFSQHGVPPTGLKTSAQKSSLWSRSRQFLSQKLHGATRGTFLRTPKATFPEKSRAGAFSNAFGSTIVRQGAEDGTIKIWWLFNTVFKV